MNANIRTAIFVAAVAILAVVLSFTLYRDHSGEKNADALRVGVGEGISGIMLRDIAAAADSRDLDIDLMVFIDCCGNAAQWAMGSGDLDIGFYCSSIALTLINLNDELFIYGPAVMNSEVVALSAETDMPGAMAIPLKRSFLSDLILENFPTVTEILQASPITLQYALSDGRTDGVVLDIAQALRNPDADYMPISGEDYISYSLVVRKEIVTTQQFADFVELYNLVASDFNDREYMQDRFGMSGDFWEFVNLKFLYL